MASRCRDLRGCDAGPAVGPAEPQGVRGAGQPRDRSAGSPVVGPVHREATRSKDRLAYSFLGGIKRPIWGELPFLIFMGTLWFLIFQGVVEGKAFCLFIPMRHALVEGILINPGVD